MLLVEYLLVCRNFDPLVRISSRNKYHLHSRLPGSYLVYGAQKTKYEQSRKIGIFETNSLMVGLVGETVQLM